MAYIILLLFFCFIAFICYRWFLHKQFSKMRAERENKLLVRKRTTVEHIRTSIQDIASEIWKISSKSTSHNDKKSTSKLVYIMVPGNPGTSSVYVHWMQIVVSMFVEQNNKTYDSMDVYIMSHAGHCSDPWNYNENKLFDLDEQIQHKIDCVKYIIKNNNLNNNCHFIFSGHSIGAFIALKILKHFEYIDIKQIHLWTPTIVNIGKSKKGLRTQKLFNYFAYVIPIIQFIGSYILPFWILKLFASPMMYNSDSVIRDFKCKNANMLLNVVHMAQHEFNEVIGLDRTEMDRLLQNYKKKIVFYWADIDGWAHKQCRIDIKDLFKKENDEEMNEIFAYWEVDNNIKHGFIMDDLAKNVEIKLAQKMLNWIDNY
eukprot:488140_1